MYEITLYIVMMYKIFSKAIYLKDDLRIEFNKKNNIFCMIIM